MRVGISTASFFPTTYTEDCFDKIKAVGGDICEVFLASFCEYSEDFIPKIVAKKSIDVHSIHCLTNQFEPETISRNDRAFADCKMWFGKVCAVGQALGAKYYTYHGATLLKKIKYNHDFPFIAKRLLVLMEIAQSFGMQLTYENVHWAYFNSPEYILQLKNYLPSISTCFDIKQAMQSKIDYKKFLVAMHSSIKTVHLCDYDAQGELLLPLGRGEVNFTELFTILKDKSPDAVALLEVYTKNYSDAKELQNSLEFLQECEARATISR